MLSQLIKSHLIQKFGITVSSAMLLSSCANQLINSKDPNNLLKLHSKQEQLVTCPESQNKNFDFNDPNKAFSIVLSPFKDLEQNLSEIPEKRKEQLDLALCNVEKSYTNLAKQILETKGKSNNEKESALGFSKLVISEQVKKQYVSLLGKGQDENSKDIEKTFLANTNKLFTSQNRVYKDSTALFINLAEFDSNKLNKDNIAENLLEIFKNYDTSLNKERVFSNLSG